MTAPRSSKPLSGARVVVTRPEDESAELARRLRKLGAKPLEAPSIRIAETRAPARLKRAIRDAAAGRFDWVVLTSAAGVGAWFATAKTLRVGAPEARVAAVGSGTAEALRSEGVEADLVPGTFTTASLGRQFPRGSGRVLLARADIAPRELEETIQARGWETVSIDAYRTVTVRSLPAPVRAALRSGAVDAILFASASTVRSFVAMAGELAGPKIVCIGPVTARAARDEGLRVHAIASPHTVDGLLEALTSALGR